MQIGTRTRNMCYFEGRRKQDTLYYVSKQAGRVASARSALSASSRFLCKYGSHHRRSSSSCRYLHKSVIKPSRVPISRNHPSLYIQLIGPRFVCRTLHLPVRPCACRQYVSTPSSIKSSCLQCSIQCPFKSCRHALCPGVCVSCAYVVRNLCPFALSLLAIRR